LAIEPLPTHEYADSHVLDTDTILKKREQEREVEIADWFGWYSAIREITRFDTSTSHWLSNITAPDVSGSSTFLDLSESWEVPEIQPERVTRRRISFSEALRLEEEIYNSLEKRKEKSRLAEARYWRFLDEDDDEK
jgi:hypothetical protein